MSGQRKAKKRSGQTDEILAWYPDYLIVAQTGALDKSDYTIFVLHTSVLAICKDLQTAKELVMERATSNQKALVK